ncbi:MAG: 4-(cytidine 5'-diphospho)-2-C-methyl-D-erythritol kinase [Gammaproteobacteria bacterium RIFCSPHIGHO2_12_FULL_38_14]|nr:MAG: 4-(cytidine 5'-diphospho)-2-C-methyl-D-erythritol kinase [Gammaproteobacteria bacterium RIFCSPHIGHO2_12_FULL_38_14]
MKYNAPAKLNLSLQITGRRADGYHLLNSIFVFTEFGDEITISPADAISLSYDGLFSALLEKEGENNLVIRAAKLLQTHSKTSLGAKIHLTKNIPIGAGLGGGSSDAATALLALNHLWQLNYSIEVLSKLGVTLGADIPACLYRRPIHVTGIGEIISPINLNEERAIVLIKPEATLSTPAVYRAYQESGKVFSTCEADYVRAGNDLQSIAIRLLPEIQIILDALSAQTGCEFSRMTGSGPTCFGFFNTKAQAINALEKLKKQFPSAWVQVTQLLTAADAHAGF